MSDDDDLASLLDEISSDSDVPESASDNGSDGGNAVVEVYQTEEISVEDNSMSSDDENSSPVTQAEVYDNLKRISELEDERQAIQEELKDRTNQLRAMLKHIDRSSILYKMLVSALPGQERETAPRAPTKSRKPAKKKTAAPAAIAPLVKKATKKKPVKRKARRK